MKDLVTGLISLIEILQFPLGIVITPLILRHKEYTRWVWVAGAAAGGALAYLGHTAAPIGGIFLLMVVWFYLLNPFSLLQNRKAVLGIVILTMFIVVAVFADQIAPYDPQQMGTGAPHGPPTWEDQRGNMHIFGTGRTGKDIFSQTVVGARTSLAVGFGAGTIIITLCIIIGITAGYVGGFVDEALSLFTNIFLIIPGLPLIIVVAGWVSRPGPTTIVLVLSFTSWAWGARVLRSQTLVLRNSEFVAAARVSGESTWRIVLFEILPNMTSLVVSSWIGAVVFVILTEATLAYIGLGNPSATSWGGTLYWARNDQALITHAWWTFVPPGACIALVGLSLTLINYGIDEITNPRLRTEGAKQK